VQGHEKVVAELSSFECVEWRYDGLNGRVIEWTLEHGNTSHDPSVLAFVVGADGTVVAKAENRVPYAAPSFAEWLRAQAIAYERAHPRTAMPFVRAVVEGTGEGEERKVRCPALETARAESKAVLLYFGREAGKDAKKEHRREAKAARRMEKGTLDSKSAAEAAEGLTLLRFDLADGDHARFAKSLGVEAAPRILLWEPDEKEPEDLGERVSASSLRYRLRKRARD